MDKLKTIGKLSFLLMCILIGLLLYLNINTHYENEVLLLIMNVVFIGFILLWVSAVAARAFLRNGDGRAMLMSCGSLMLALGAMLAALARFLPNAANVSVTTFNLAALAGGALNLAAATLKQPFLPLRLSGYKKTLACASLALTTAAIVYVLLSSMQGHLPAFLASSGSTQIRDIILWVTVSVYLGASVAFAKNNHRHQVPHLFWYSISLLMLSLGLFAVGTAKSVGSALGWAGRVCECIGCFFAFLSMLQVMQTAKKEGVSPAKIVQDFFADAEENYLSLVENLSCAIVNVDEEFRVFFTNGSAQSLFRYTGSEFMGLPFVGERLTEPSRSLISEDFLRFRRTGASDLNGKTIRIEATDSDSNAFPAQMSLSYCKLSTGYASTYIIQDLSDHLRQEEKLIRQAEELKRKNRLITDFFTNISHEFKTPLTIILNAIELTELRLRDASFDNKERVCKNLGIMRQNSHRLLRLIANLLDVTKIDAGFLRLNNSDVEIGAWMKKLIDSVDVYASRRNLELSFTDTLPARTVQLDGEKLDRIMLNLLSNSIKHTPPGGRVSVSLAAAGDKILITVEDTGEGIPADKQGMVFDRFSQVNTKMTRTTEGSGIGLALTKSLVELLHGRIWFESAYGCGTKFFVELPTNQNDRSLPMPVMDSMTLQRKVEMEFSDIL